MTPTLLNIFAENAPNGLSVLVSALVPLVAFGLPWWLARRDTSHTGKPRRTAILMFAFPILILWLVLNSVLAPVDHVGTVPNVSRHEAVMVKSPRTVGELLIRVGIGGFGAALLIWATGAVAAKVARSKQSASESDSAAANEPRVP